MKPIRTALFVPGSRPERFEKALAVGADRVIVDFEDAVEPSLKEAARTNLAKFLEARPDVRVVVRVNAFRTREFEEDLKFCAAHPQLEAVMLAKAEHPYEVRELVQSGHKVWPLIESARGLVNIGEIAAEPGVEVLSFGALDYCVQLRVDPASAAGQRQIDQVRMALVLHSALNELMPPIDTVFPDIHDQDRLKKTASNARDLGFGGMLCIHPSQVSIVTTAFKPADEALAWAKRVLEAAEGQPGVFRFEGRMVDAPVLDEARRLLELA